MFKKFLLLLCLSLSFGVSVAQQSYTLSGVVNDDKGASLVGASVVLQPIAMGVVTTTDGSFILAEIPEGSYLLEIKFVGFETFSDSIKVDKDQSLNVNLKPTSINLHEVVIEDNLAEIRKSEESLNIEVVNDDYLKMHLGGSLMSSLERLPGVSQIEIGSGQSKPVIRGLGFNRVVVVENNIKHESQQWGADHGLEIDQYALDYIEVIKGPSSLMYGSDAIGGVVDMKTNRVPQMNSIGGQVDFTAKSNNDLLGGSVNLYGRNRALFADLRFTYLDYADYKVPADSVDIYSYRAALDKGRLRNTAGLERNLHFTLGYLKKGLQSRLLFSNVYSRSGFFANTHGLEPRNIDTELHDASNRDILFPFQEVQHLKLINRNHFSLRKLKVEFDLGFQQNTREEWSMYTNHGYMPALFPDTAAFDQSMERQFTKQVYSSNLKFRYAWSDKGLFRFGVSAELHNNDIDGRGFIIPKYQQQSLGSYLLYKHNISDKSHLQLGVRYDFGSIKTHAYSDWFPSLSINGNDTSWVYLQRAEGVKKQFSNLSWSIGYRIEKEHWEFNVNAGKSFRMPIAKELAANGVNYHRFSFEVGNPNLDPEQSYQLDLGLEYHNQTFALGLTPFVNYFSNYIFLNPSSEHDRLYGNGNQVFYYTQSTVLRVGGELHSHIEITKNLQGGLVGEYVYSEQLSGEKKGFSLPFSPPASAIFNLKYSRAKLWFLNDASLAMDLRVNAAQNRIVPPEFRTESSQTINLALGGDIKLKKQRLRLSFQVRNLLNQKYFNHTSYYRIINIPEPGRNFVLNVSIPFSKTVK
jgi:iron complex outermembrane receptor protein